MPIVVGILGMALKGLERRLEDLEIRGRIETIKTCQEEAQLAWEMNSHLLNSAIQRKLDK